MLAASVVMLITVAGCASSRTETESTTTPSSVSRSDATSVPGEASRTTVEPVPKSSTPATDDLSSTTPPTAAPDSGPLDTSRPLAFPAFVLGTADATRVCAFYNPDALQTSARPAIIVVDDHVIDDAAALVAFDGNDEYRHSTAIVSIVVHGDLIFDASRNEYRATEVTVEPEDPTTRPWVVTTIVGTGDLQPDDPDGAATALELGEQFANAGATQIYPTGERFIVRTMQPLSAAGQQLLQAELAGTIQIETWGRHSTSPT